jgi:hypothetical protein
VDTSVKRIVQNNGVAEMVIEPEKMKSKKGYTNSGTLTATNVLIESHPTFTDVSKNRNYSYFNNNNNNKIFYHT